MAARLQHLLATLDNRYAVAFDNGMTWRDWQANTVSGKRYAQLRAMYRKVGK